MARTALEVFLTARGLIQPAWHRYSTAGQPTSKIFTGSALSTKPLSTGGQRTRRAIGKRLESTHSQAHKRCHNLIKLAVAAREASAPHTVPAIDETAP